MEDIEDQLDAIHQLKDDKKYDECLKLCEKVIAAHPTDARPFYERAFTRTLVGDTAGAIGDVTRAQQLSPQEPAFFYFSGLWNLELNEAARAEAELDRCIELEHQHRDEYYLESAHLLRAIARLKLGNPQGAIEDCDGLTNDFSTFVDRLYRAGEVKREAQARLRK